MVYKPISADFKETCRCGKPATHVSFGCRECFLKELGFERAISLTTSESKMESIVKKEGKESGNQPDYNVKTENEYVGSGWVKDGKYGKYLSVIINSDVKAGTSLYISQRKNAAKSL